MEVVGIVKVILKSKLVVVIKCGKKVATSIQIVHFLSDSCFVGSSFEAYRCKILINALDSFCLLKLRHESLVRLGVNTGSHSAFDEVLGIVTR